MYTHLVVVYSRIIWTLVKLSQRRSQLFLITLSEEAVANESNHEGNIIIVTDNVRGGKYDWRRRGEIRSSIFVYLFG